MDRRQNPAKERGKEVEQFLGRPHVAALIAALFATVFSDGVHNAISSGQYWKAAGMVVALTFFGFVLWAVGRAALQAALSRSKLFFKAGKWRKLIAFAMLVIVYVVVLIVWRWLFRLG